jgi:hypothetical protein
MIFIPLFYYRDRDKEVVKKRFESFSHIVIFAIISCCSFIYTIISTILAQYFIEFGINSVIILFLIIPGIIGIFNYKLIVGLCIVLKKKVFMRPEHYYSLAIILLVALILRFPYFIIGEFGIDTFKFNTLSNLFVETGKIGYLLSPLSIFQLYPDSLITSSIIYTSNLTILSGIASYESAFLISVYAGIFSSITFYFLVYSYPLKNIMSKRAKRMAIIIYISLPLLLKFSDWSISARIMFFMVLPSVTIISTNIMFNKELRFKKIIILLIIILFTLILSHGMGRIFFLYLIALGVIKFVLVKIKIKKFNNIKWFKPFFLLFGVFLFFLPYLMYQINIKFLVNNWMLTRTDLINLPNIGVFDNIIGFFFIFGARMGIVALFLIIGLIFIPILKLEPNSEVFIFIFPLFLFFPFFAHSMYFYQSLSLIMVIIGCILFDSFLNWIKEIFLKFNNLKINLIKKNNFKIYFFFLIGNLILTGFIQYYRSTGEGYPITIDVINTANYLHYETIDSNQRNLAISSNIKLSYRISAYSSNILSFPHSSEIFIAAFPEKIDDINYYQISLFPISLEKIIKIFRYGIFRSDANTILDGINDIIYEKNMTILVGNFSKFIQINTEYNFRYLIHEESDNWPLLEYLILNNYVNYLESFGNINIYELDL